MESWEARVVFAPGKMANGVYLSRRKDIGVREYLRSDNTVITVKNGEPTKEPIEFAWLDDEQLEALSAAFDQHGVKRPDAGFTEGKLQATEKHLEDMRSIVGHVKKIPLKEEHYA